LGGAGNYIALDTVTGERVTGDWPESNLLELATGLVLELFPNSFSISFSQTADWRRFCDLGNVFAFCQSAAREKEIEKEFGNNSRTSPLASSRRLDSGHGGREEEEEEEEDK
jgi:hypothetical protein